MAITFGSVCSGIEAASVAWEPLGWKAAWLSEIEPFPCAVLKHHYPDVPNHGDMTLLPDRILSGEIFAPDIFCGGTPCQAFSIAGLRKSLDDERGNLSLTFCEIADAIDTIRAKQKQPPCIVFWENVPGVLNTSDNAFGCFLAGLAGEDEALVAPGGRWTNAGFIDGPQRAIAWRVLDAQYFGVAQRRRRVFVVASARDGFDPAAVLFEFDGMRRDTAPSREAGQKPAPTVVSGPPFSRTGNERVECEAIVAQCLTSGTGQRYDPETETILATPTHYRKSRRAQSTEDHETWVEDDTTNTLNCFDLGDVRTVEAVVQPIPLDLRNAGRDPEKHDEMNRQGVGIGDAGDPAHTVTSAFVHGVAQPIPFQQTADCLTAAYGTKWNGNASADNGSLFAQQNMAVRRLTPVECERLQGFPDNYTNIPWRNKTEAPDGPRYKALGNSWAVPVVRWIGERIVRALG